VYTDNEFFNRVLERSLYDLRMLWSSDDDGSRFTVAGTPWFDALFGRDALIVGMQTLAFQPQIAREALRTLAKHQGTAIDESRMEEPGKILHEMRRGEVSQTNELPFKRFYGSVDSTPLFLLLAAEYYAWTADVGLARELAPNIVAALDWIDAYGDRNRDGYIEYYNPRSSGLLNQGWKDSDDAICHFDGTLAPAPIALVEAQSYVYAAKTRLAPLLRSLGHDALAERILREARLLKRRFERDYWRPDPGYYALALDGSDLPCASVSSNPGHALWSGIVGKRRARSVVETLLGEDLFSGWGIRTLSQRNPRYNPLGYHLGTVWPHDNAIAAMGFKMYGFEDETNEVATALFDAAMTFPYSRLPELFGGEARTAHHSPVSYPVACRPQAWAAGAMPMLLQAILGLRAAGYEDTLQVVQPRLPYWLSRVHVRGLRVGEGEVDLTLARNGKETDVQIGRVTGGIRVELLKRWPI
jgi:glycogen debranching enzyme